MEIVRKKLTADELTSPGTRYDEDCNCIQRSVDGGTTWTDSPGDDPRHADAWRLPSIVADDPQCQAAANMAALVKDTIDQFVLSGGIASAGTGMLDLWLIAVGPVGWVVDLVVILAEVLFAITIVAIELTFTSTVYDELECIFYCHIDADGQCSAAQLSAILDDIHALGDGVIDGVMDALLNTWGEVGLSNAGAVGTATADCDGCECCEFVALSTQDYGTIDNTGGNNWLVNATLLEGFGYGCNIINADEGQTFTISAIAVVEGSGDPPSAFAYRDMETMDIVPVDTLEDLIGHCTNFAATSEEIGLATYQLTLTACLC